MILLRAKRFLGNCIMHAGEKCERSFLLIRFLWRIPAVLFGVLMLCLLAWCVSGCCGFRMVGTWWTPGTGRSLVEYVCYYCI